MTTCKTCGRPVIACRWGDGKTVPTQDVFLDVTARTFAGIADGRVDLQDGDKVFTSSAFAEHKTTCPGKRDPEVARRTRGKHTPKTAPTTIDVETEPMTDGEE